MLPSNALLTKSEVAAELRITTRALELMEKAKNAPPRVDLGIRRALYRREDVLAWIAGRGTPKDVD